MNCEKIVYFDTQKKSLSFKNDAGVCVELQIVGAKGKDGQAGRNGTMFAGTTNFITKFVNPTTIGNSSLFDDGNIGYGTITPNSVAAFDIVSTTKGMLFPRMTTVQRDAIVVGATEDSLFIFNTTTEKFNFWNDTLGIWESIDTATGGDVSGAGTTNFIPRWTDGPNSVLGDSIIRDNGTVAAVNRAIIAGTMFAIQGADAGAVNFTLQTYNSTPTATVSVRNDGKVGVNTTSPAALIHGVGLTNDATDFVVRMDSSTVNNMFTVRNDGFTGFGVSTPTSVGFSAAGNTVEMTKTLLLTTDNASIALMRTGGANYLIFENSNNFNITQSDISGAAFNPKMTFYPSGIIKVSNDSDNGTAILSRFEILEDVVGISDALSLSNNQAVAVGNGSMLSFNAQADDGNLKTYAGIFGIATSTGTLTYDGDLVFETTLNSSLAEKGRIRSNGIWNLGTMPTFLNDAAAGVGGLVTGDLFQETATGHVLIKQ